MLDLQQLRQQLERLPETQFDNRRLREEQRARAVATLREIADVWQTVQKDVEEASPRRLVASLRARPTTVQPAPSRPTPVTVVATDGSQIYPDRHVEPAYFLLNIGRVAFQYGTTEPPTLDAVPDLRFADDLDEHFDEVLASMTTEIVSALRDEQELAELLALARDRRFADRPLVALADGTLIRWMLRGMQNRVVEEALIERYTGMLRDFMADELPIASYISMPGNTELVNLLRFYLGELDDNREQPIARGDGASRSQAMRAVPLGETGTRESAEGPRLAGLLDRHVVRAILQPGQRSAVFGSTSHIQRQYPEGNEICYFYLNVPVTKHDSEIARIEIPAWVADRSELVDRIHATVMSECRKGEGYPLVLAEAHERAVIRAPERESFQRLLDRTLRRAGLPSSRSRKRSSKQRPRV